MAIDTKPNFSCTRFEQCSDDVMNLSGCTQIYGIFDMESGSTFTICDNVGDGKVLTSNSSGAATWQTPSVGGTITGGTNGLSTSGANIVLGGTLTGNTTINVATHDLKFSGDSVQYVADYSSTYIARSLTDADFVTGCTSTALSSANSYTDTCASTTLSSANNYTDSQVGSGISWSGNTVSGLTTYVDTNTICVQPNLTFNGSVLNVSGQVETDTIKITTGAGAGCVLESDASGNASWETPSGGGDISWSGSNVCGIGTYIDANTICSEPNLSFSGGTTLGISGSTVRAALMTEMNGEIIDFGTNYHQAGIRNENYDAGLFRIDIRPPYPLFNVIYRESGSSTSEEVLFSVCKSGEVGIGTTSPGAKLDIYQGNIIINPASGGVQSILGYEGGDANPHMGIDFNFTGTTSANRIDISDWSSGSAVPRVSILRDGKVGINDTTPSYTLDVNGTGRFTEAVEIKANSNHLILKEADNSDKRWDVHVNTGDLFFTEFGVGNQMVILEGGDVGIGTTGPAYKLEVNGIIANTYSRGIVTNWKSTRDDPTNNKWYKVGELSMTGQYQIYQGIFTVQAKAITSTLDGTVTYKLNARALAMGSTPIVSIDHLGSVGNNGSGIPDVKAILSTDSGDEKVIELFVGGVDAGYLYYNHSILTQTTDIGGLFTIEEGDAGVLVGSLPAGTSYDMIQTITTLNNGNVGIGTTIPASLLHLSSTNATLTMTDTDTNADFKIVHDSSLGGVTINADANAEVASTYLRLGVDGDNVINIDAAQNVGIGDTTPSYKLDVNGTGRFTCNLTSNGYITTNTYQMIGVPITSSLSTSAIPYILLYKTDDATRFSISGTFYGSRTDRNQGGQIHFTFGTDGYGTGRVGAGVSAEGAHDDLNVELYTVDYGGENWYAIRLGVATYLNAWQADLRLDLKYAGGSSGWLDNIIFVSNGVSNPVAWNPEGGVFIAPQLSISGTLNVSSHIYQGDNDYHYFGSGNDAGIYHSGTVWYFKSYLHGAGIQIEGENAGGTNKALIYADPDGAASLYHAGSKRISTAATGLDLSGSGTGAANQSLLYLYESNGSTRQGYMGVASGSDNNLMIVSDVGHVITNPAANYGTYLRFGSANKLATSATGIDVTGTGTFSTGVTIDGISLQHSDDRDGLLEINQRTTSSYSGIQARRTNGETWSFMGSDDLVGIYDDKNDDWVLIYYENSCVALTHGGNVKFKTTSTGACVTGVACVSTCLRTPYLCVNGSGGVHVSASLSCGSAIDWIATSDCRIKKCIEPITCALSRIDAMCGVCYELREDNTKDMGLIAQDVEIVEPRLVTRSEVPEEYEKYGIEDEILGLKYDKFAGLFVEAIKELKTQNVCLQNQINELRKIK